MITGKPLQLGGSAGRGTATAQGAMYVIEKHLKEEGKPVPGTTVAIQGFGNAGATIAKLLHDAGYTIVAVSDSQGTLIRPGGLDPYEVEGKRVKNEKRSVTSLYCDGSVCDKKAMKVDGVRVEDANTVLTAECDILIPAALDNVVTSKNVEAVQASIILELANNPISPEADTTLFTKGVTVIPDVLANAGGVSVSYFEWVQNRQQFYWTEAEVSEKLASLMVTAYQAVRTKTMQEGISYRQAAYLIGVERIVEAMRLRGHLQGE